MLVGQLEQQFLLQIPDETLVRVKLIYLINRKPCSEKLTESLVQSENVNSLI